MPLIYAFPPELRPSTDDVAAVLRTRTIEGGMTDSGKFTATTRPTAVEVGDLIDQAMGPVLSQLPASFDRRFFDLARNMVTLYAAISVEASYFREQFDKGSATLLETRYEAGMKTLRQDTGTVDGAGKQYGSIGVVSVPNPPLLPGIADGFQPFTWPL